MNHRDRQARTEAVRSALARALFLLDVGVHDYAMVYAAQAVHQLCGLVDERKVRDAIRSMTA